MRALVGQDRSIRDRADVVSDELVRQLTGCSPQGLTRRMTAMTSRKHTAQLPAFHAAQSVISGHMQLFCSEVNQGSGLCQDLEPTRWILERLIDPDFVDPDL